MLFTFINIYVRFFNLYIKFYRIFFIDNYEIYIYIFFYYTIKEHLSRDYPVYLKIHLKNQI